MEPGQIYHVFNHANGWENLFQEPRNYHFFMEKMDRFLSPTIDIFAHCLMPNHFHLAVGIPEMKELILRNKDFDGMNQEDAGKKISKQFSNLFSSYTLSFNNFYNRTGSLFRPNMKTKEVDSEISFCKLIHYIHANPVHHGFVDKIEDWPFSSYSTYKSNLQTNHNKNYVLNSFGGYKQFMNYHTQQIDLKLGDIYSEKSYLKMLSSKKSIDV
jgi:REP element-mobilizing transposase RayT